MSSSAGVRRPRPPANLELIMWLSLVHLAFGLLMGVLYWWHMLDHRMLAPTKLAYFLGLVVFSVVANGAFSIGLRWILGATRS